MTSTHGAKVCLFPLIFYLRTDSFRFAVEVVICVPICWTASANAIMCNCVLQAMKRARFGFKDDNSVPGLFMVNEAEAAATFALRAGLHSLKVLYTPMRPKNSDTDIYISVSKPSSS